MLNLMLNENMKIYRRLRTWILVAVIVALTAAVLLIIHNDTPSLTEGGWKTEVQNEIANKQKSLENKEISESRKLRIASEIKTDTYRLEHNIPPTERSLWYGIMIAGANLIFLCTIFTVVIAADSVAGEFSGGTIKLLLIRPANRSKVLLSKYLATLLFSLLLLLVLFTSAFLLSGTLEGFKDIGIPHIYAGTDLVVHEVSMIGHVLMTYGYSSVELVMIVTLAFMLSTVFRSSSLAIGISLGLLFIGPTVVDFIAKYSWAKYFLFSNTLTQYLENSPVIEGMTLQFSIGVLVVYFVLFNLLSWTIFRKRDVAA